MIDAFDAAAGQVKVETEGEKRIAESYQVPLLNIPAHTGQHQSLRAALVACD